MDDSARIPSYDYKFCPLVDPAEDLRILKLTLHSDSSDDKVEGQIVPFDERQQIEYAALSWCWGPRDASRATMRITHKDAPYDFEISESLDSALKQLRRLKREYLWIDQVCINQGDVSERNNQVRLMAKIYAKAKLVYVWLGDDKEKTPAGSPPVTMEDGEAAFRFINTNVLHLKYFDKLVKDETHANDWVSLVELMKREWFSRRWVVQEIALARDAKILCGTHSMSWLDFADAVSLFNGAENEKFAISRAIMPRREYGYKPRYFGHVHALSATKLVQITNDLFRRRGDTEREALLSLEQLVSTFTSFNASEPRDTIYAVLAIARDTMPQTSHANMRNMTASYSSQIQEKFIEQLSQKIVAKSYYVNYEQPVSDVFVDFVDFAISQSDKTRALDILCRPWAPPPTKPRYRDSRTPWRATYDPQVSKRAEGRGKDSLPSWIPSIADAAYGMEPSSRRMVRKNPDTLVGLPPQRNYTASGGVPVTRALRFEEGVTRGSTYPSLNEVHYHSLFVEGFLVDKIETLGTASQKGMIPKDWGELGRQSAFAGEQWTDLPDEYWRTLIADRSKNGNPPRHYPRMINYALKSDVEGETFSTQDKIDHPDCQAVSEVLERVQSVIWNRKLMRTSKRLGLVPEGAKEGDLIVILYGCSVPIVLRRFVKTQAEVKNERDTKITRQEKLVARKITENFRKAVAQGKQRRPESAPGTPRKSSGRVSTPGSGRAPSDAQTHDFASIAAPLDQSLDHAGASQPEQTYASQDPPQSVPDPEISRPHSRDADSASMKSERSLQMPGGWLKTPPISRQGTHIVAPGPILPKSVAEVGKIPTTTSITSSTSSTEKASVVSAKPGDTSLRADEHTFYQLIGECYLHGMMNGEAIPMQRSAEEEAKQKSAPSNIRLETLRKDDQEAKNQPKQEYIKRIHRSFTEPVAEMKETKLPKGVVEPAMFIRTLFELR